MKVFDEDGNELDNEALLGELRRRVADTGELSPKERKLVFEIIEFWKGMTWTARLFKWVFGVLIGGATLVGVIRNLLDIK